VPNPTITVSYDSWSFQLQYAANTMYDSFLNINQALGDYVYARPTDTRKYALRNQKITLHHKFDNLTYKFYFTESEPFSPNYNIAA
jgi:hypothetical protein